MSKKRRNVECKELSVFKSLSENNEINTVHQNYIELQPQSNQYESNTLVEFCSKNVNVNLNIEVGQDMTLDRLRDILCIINKTV